MTYSSASAGLLLSAGNDRKHRRGDAPVDPGAYAGEYSLMAVYWENAQGEVKYVAEGYEFTRLVSAVRGNSNRRLGL